MRDLPIRLVFVGGVPHWRLPEGAFLKADLRDGKIVEPGITLKSARSPW
jgi:hypothetical protein